MQGETNFGEPVPRPPNAIDQARINAWAKEIHKTCDLSSPIDAELTVHQVYEQLVSQAITYYYAYSAEGMVYIKYPRVRITQSFHNAIPAKIECGWGGFKPKEPVWVSENVSDPANQTSVGAPTRKTPDATDYARVNSWKGVILEKCGLPEYKDKNFYILQAYYQIVSGTNYYYELYPQGILGGTHIKCTIHQPLEHQSGIPSDVKCGWGDFKGTSLSSNNSKNQGRCLPGRTVQEADKILVNLNKATILAKCGDHLPPWVHLDILQVKEEVFTEGEYASKLYYELYPHGMTGAKPIYTMIFVQLLPTVKYEVTCGWDGECQ